MRSAKLIFSMLFLCALFAGPAAATGCLEPVGSPYEKGDEVCIKVKNTCNEIVAVDWEVGTYNFGIQGSGPQSTDSDSIAIDPGGTAEICSKKPTNSGKYCFFFKIKNRDQQKPTDSFYRWLNNIQVAMVGGMGRGNFEVGGSGLVNEDVILVARAPHGWSIDLSDYYVAAADFPKTVNYTIWGPHGEDAILKVTAISAHTREEIGDAQFTISADTLPVDAEPVTTPNPVLSPVVSSASAVPSDRDGEPVPSEGEPEPKPTSPPKPTLSFAGEEQGLVSGPALLFAWDEDGVFTPIPRATFEFFGDDGWQVIADEKDRPAGADLGIAMATWDTSDLPSGDYMIRVTMFNEAGRPGSAERWITVAKRPQAESTAVFSDQATVRFDGSQSFDSDGQIVEWRWDFGDGKKGFGESVTHTYSEITSYPVTLTVTDTTGLETTAYCQADISKGLYSCMRTCGCESMEIRGDNTNAAIEYPGYTGGGKANGPQVPTWAGGNSNGSFAYRFEVLATLTKDSDPSLCTYSQWAKRTGMIGNTTSHKKHKGKEYPLNGSSYGNDGPEPAFTEADGTANPPTIRWIDAPGLHPRTPRGKKVSYNGKFFAMVSGPAGTCKCSWEIDMEINAQGQVTTQPTLKNVDCS